MAGRARATGLSLFISELVPPARPRGDFFGLVSKWSMPDAMTYIVQRKDRFYVVAYDGLDPLTGKERRRWHPIGHDRNEAESVAARIDRDRAGAAPVRGGPVHLGEFLTGTWLPMKRRHVRATTAYRYSWFVDRYINPAIGDVPLRRLRADHLEGLYDHLATTAGRDGTGLAPKTVHDVHAILRASLDLAVRRQLLEHNIAHSTHGRRRRPTSVRPRAWTAHELADFLKAARAQRLYPALHLDAYTGMRRGEVVGLKWSDLDRTTKRLSISRTLQNVAGNPVEFDVKTRTSRRCIDIDDHTMWVLAQWRRKLYRDGLSHGADDWMFLNTTGRFLNPESVTQLFNRIVQRTPALPRIRFHDLRHTHASLLIMAGVPIKVVSERLGHSHPAFTMHTYQHLLPGMSAAAAEQFAALIKDPSR